ncbi:MAG: YSC84-related protein [Desulfobulbaceae bacterium]|nr:YSC84-related protein [Desulfobulbaceae bacterium]
MVRLKRIEWVVLMVAVVLLAGCAAPKGSTLREKKNYVLEMRSEALAKLYKEKPYVRKQIENAEGYGVFSNINTNLFLVSTARGYGVVVDNKSGKQTYMQMGQLGVGPGLGLKDFRVVIVFNNRKVMNDFVAKGWEFGGHADAAAKSGEKGGAVGGEAYVAQGISVYTMTEAGAALQATVAGTKYWKDDELN